MKRDASYLRGAVLAGFLPLMLASCGGGDPETDRPPIVYEGSDPAAPAPAQVRGDPLPDARGVIVYPDYAVVIARDGDSLESIAGRVGLSTAELASYNGLPANWRPREGDTLVLPPGAAIAPVAPSAIAAQPLPGTAPATTPGTPPGPGTPGWSPELVTAAIERAPDSPAVPPLSDPGTPPGALPPGTVPPLSDPGTVTTPDAPAPVTPPDAVASLPPAAVDPVPVNPGPGDLAGSPIRHSVAPGETIYSISRLYGVPVAQIAAWNGLGRDYTLRPGQVVEVPVQGSATPVAPAPARVAVPGTTEAIATPPSAADPLPPNPPAGTIPASPNLEQYRTDSTVAARLLAPVQGPIAKPYVKSGPGRNDGVDFAANAGAPVLAADAGEVALISNSLGGLGKIVLIRHPGGLTTVYGRVDNVTVKKGDMVARGQVIGEVASTASPSLHFEVRKGAESVDPANYL